MASSRRRDEAGIYIDNSEFAAILDSLSKLPKEANREMRAEADDIAETIMKPAIVSAIMSHAGNYGPRLAKTVRTRQDRVPSVKVGTSQKYSKVTGRTTHNMNPNARGEFSGGATPNMIRFGTIKGGYVSRSGKFQAWAENVTPGWTDAADEAYAERAFDAWEKTANQLVDRWNKGMDY